jgi:hypothetical protein
MPVDTDASRGFDHHSTVQFEANSRFFTECYPHAATFLPVFQAATFRVASNRGELSRHGVAAELKQKYIL